MSSPDQRPGLLYPDSRLSVSTDLTRHLTESASPFLDPLKPIAIAGVGLTPEQAQHAQQNSERRSLGDEQLLHRNDCGLNPEQHFSGISADPKVIKEARRVTWQETGRIPPIKGGQDKKREKENSIQMNWELFDTDPHLARQQLTAIYQGEHPEWDEVKIAREVAHLELIRKIERHYELGKQFGEEDERVRALYEDIKFWRLVLKGFKA
jgi:hypothetical protein